MERNTKIVATLGPSCSSDEQLRGLFMAGINVARLNFSHGTHDDHALRIAMVRRLSKELGTPVSIMQDLQGPKMRVGILPENGFMLEKGRMVVLAHPDVLKSGAPGIPIDIPGFAKNVVPGNRILLDDGRLELEVASSAADKVTAKVIIGGVITSHKGVNLPHANLNIPSFTEKDHVDLEFGLSQGVDLIAISFVRSAVDVTLIRDKIHSFNPELVDTPIIAKLERPEAIEKLDEIILEADGVMVARGDLGVETSPAYVPIIQKQIIQNANAHGKMVITATQMLDSMIHNPRPTRAEASDVANAIFDGTDAVMLSGETASGDYPIESVKMMDSIVREAEKNMSEWGHCNEATDVSGGDDAFALTRAAREIAHDLDVACIAVFTQSGKTAVLMSKARPRVPILAFTPSVRTFQRLNLLWGVIPYLIPFSSTVETMLGHVEDAMISSAALLPGQQVVILSGFPVGAMRPPNFALLHTLGRV